MLVCSPLFTHGYLPSLGCWRLTQWRLPSLTNLTLPLLASYDRTSWCRGRGPLFCGCSLRIWWIIINVIRGKVALHDAFLFPLLSVCASCISVRTAGSWKGYPQLLLYDLDCRPRTLLFLFCFAAGTIIYFACYQHKIPEDNASRVHRCDCCCICFGRVVWHHLSKNKSILRRTASVRG